MRLCRHIRNRFECFHLSQLSNEKPRVLVRIMSIDLQVTEAEGELPTACRLVSLYLVLAMATSKLPTCERHRYRSREETWHGPYIRHRSCSEKHAVAEWSSTVGGNYNAAVNHAFAHVGYSQ
jgi:hypothetical protein